MLEIIEEMSIHFIALILSLGVVYYAWKAKAGFSGKVAKAFSYFFLGVVLLMMIHASELIGPDGLHLYVLDHEAQEKLEHLFFSLGMFSFIVGFYKMFKATQE